jgi:hypothetical protein
MNTLHQTLVFSILETLDNKQKYLLSITNKLNYKLITQYMWDILGDLLSVCMKLKTKKLDITKQLSQTDGLIKYYKSNTEYKFYDSKDDYLFHKTIDYVLSSSDKLDDNRIKNIIGSPFLVDNMLNKLSPKYHKKTPLFKLHSDEERNCTDETCEICNNIFAEDSLTWCECCIIICDDCTEDHTVKSICGKDKCFECLYSEPLCCACNKYMCNYCSRCKCSNIKMNLCGKCIKYYCSTCSHKNDNNNNKVMNTKCQSSICGWCAYNSNCPKCEEQFCGEVNCPSCVVIKCDECNENYHEECIVIEGTTVLCDECR